MSVDGRTGRTSATSPGEHEVVVIPPRGRAVRFFVPDEQPNAPAQPPMLDPRLNEQVAQQILQQAQPRRRLFSYEIVITHPRTIAVGVMFFLAGVGLAGMGVTDLAAQFCNTGIDILKSIDPSTALSTVDKSIDVITAFAGSLTSLLGGVSISHSIGRRTSPPTPSTPPHAR